MELEKQRADELEGKLAAATAETDAAMSRLTADFRKSVEKVSVDDLPLVAIVDC